MEIQNEKKELINGTLIYFIGNASVSVLQLLILKIITSKIPSAGYGYYDYVVSISNLVIPLLTLQISDAVFRFIVRAMNDDEVKRYFTNGFIVNIVGMLLLLFFVYLVDLFIYPIKFTLLVGMFTSSNLLFLFYQKVVRALGKNIDYVRINILKVIAYLLIQLILIYVFDIGEESILIATTLSTVFCIILLEKSIDSRKFFNVKSLDINTLKEMIIFSFPLVPNTIVWWLSGSVNALIISYYIGMNANGIYSIAGRFASLITVFSGVFNMAWQESAIKTYGSNNSKIFYKRTFHFFYIFIFTTCVACIPVMKIILPYMIDKSYYESLKYAPLLLLGAAIAAVYGFFGQLYGAIGKTGGIAKTTIYGGLINFLTIFFLIKEYGLWAICVATVMSSLTIAILRFIQLKDEVSVRFEKEMVIILGSMAVVLVAYYCGGIEINITVICCTMVLFYLLNKDLLFDIKDAVVSRFKK